MNKFARAAIACTTVCGALAFALPALAKMSGVEEEQYNETMQAAQALEKSKDWAKAREKFVDAREQAIKGQDKKKELRSLLKVGNVFLEQGHYDSAQANFKEGVTIAEANLDVGDGLLASSLYDLSNVLQRQKRDSEAKPYFSRCLEISKKVFSPDHPTLAVHTGEYASLLNRLGDKEEGAKLANQSQAIIDKFMGEMSAKIRKAWSPAPENFSYRVAVLYEILDHGKVGKVEVTQSSGSPSADKSAIAAVKDGAPFADITWSDPDDKLYLAFNFDYNYQHRHKPDADRSSSSTRSTASRRQSREVQEETEVKRREEKARSEKLKEQIDDALKSSATDGAQLASLYVQLAESITVQGEPAEAVTTLKNALKADSFKNQQDPQTISLLIALAHIYLNAPDLGDAATTLKDQINAKSFAQVPLKLRQEALEDYGSWLSTRHRFAEAQDYYSRGRDLKD